MAIHMNGILHPHVSLLAPFTCMLFTCIFMLQIIADPPSDPVITQEASTDDLKTGTIMVLTCCSDAIPPPQYMWYKRNMITYDTEPLTNAAGMFSSTLYVPITGIADSGVYICTAFNSAGTSIMEFLVDLTPEGKIFFLTNIRCISAIYMYMYLIFLVKQCSYM